MSNILKCKNIIQLAYPPRGAKWIGKGTIISKPLGFKHHPLEGVGTVDGRNPAPPGMYKTL